MADDEVYLPEIAAHSLEKIRRHNYYATLFATSMARKWYHRVYIGLYAGAGKAILKNTGEITETSALAVLRQEHPFTKYVFVDSDPRCLAALRAYKEELAGDRDVTFIESEVNASIPAVLRAMPRYNPRVGQGMISLCFIDPFRIDLDFAVIRELSRFTIDFLIMLPFGFDLRRNLAKYFEPNDDRVARLIDDPDWRSDWNRRDEPRRKFVRFALEKFNIAMERLNFRRRKLEEIHPVKVSGMGVYLYSLGLYTRHELGDRFWKQTLSGTEQQLKLDF